MLVLPLTLAQAQRLWHQDFRALCEALPLQARTRTHPARYDADGHLLRPARTEHYHVQPKAAPSSAKGLMAHLVFRSIRALEQRNRELMGGDGPAALEAPAVAVNCRDLGRYCSLSSRTVRTLLDALLRLGALTRKAWHGTRADFEVWVNPKYLWKSVVDAGDNCLDALCRNALLLGEATKLPVRVAFETLETKKLKCSPGDKLVTGLALTSAAGAGLATWATLTRNTGPQLPAQAATRLISERASSAGPAELLPANLAQQMSWVTAFWDKARTLLYAHVSFSQAQQELARETIWNGVYGAFGLGKSHAESVRYHQGALERIDLVAAWLERHPDQYLPAPYAELVPGRGYFDRANSRGFGATEEWLVRKLERTHAHHVARTLRRAAAHLRGWRTGKAPRWVLDLPKAQLIRHYRQQVEAWHDTAALQQFLRFASGHVA